MRKIWIKYETIPLFCFHMKQVSGCCSWEQPGACRRRQGELKDHNAVLLVVSLHFSSVALGGVWGCCRYRWVTQAVPRYNCDPVPPSPVAYISLKSIRSGEKRSIQSFKRVGGQWGYWLSGLITGWKQVAFQLFSDASSPSTEVTASPGCLCCTPCAW